jgi:hypothetical protein
MLVLAGTAVSGLGLGLAISNLGPEVLSLAGGLTLAFAGVLIPVLIMSGSIQRNYVSVGDNISVNARWYVNNVELYLYLRREWCGR